LTILRQAIQNRAVQLTLQQAATKLGKTSRQIRYMIQTGKLQATKSGASWRINSDALPLSERQVEAAMVKEQRTRAALEDALEPKGARRRRYSFRDLRAAKVAVPLLQAATEALGADHSAVQSMKHALKQLARGCHRYRREDKVAAYRAARDEASNSACELVIDGGAAALEFVDHIEQELMPAIAGLVRRCERQREPAR
jgi:excisionase family DNA binding protein